MSKERQHRRREREREAAVVAAARASQAERRERRERRRRGLASLLPRPRSRPTGILAQRRRRQTGATIALVIALNVLVWVFFPGWPARLMMLILSLLVAPVLHAVLFRRR